MAPKLTPQERIALIKRLPALLGNEFLKIVRRPWVVYQIFFPTPYYGFTSHQIFNGKEEISSAAGSSVFSKLLPRAGKEVYS